MATFAREKRRAGWAPKEIGSANHSRRYLQRCPELEGQEEVILDEQTDPTFFCIAPDGKIRGKAVATQPRNAIASQNRKVKRDMRHAPSRTRLPPPPPPSGPRDRSHEAEAAFDDQISIAIALSLSLNEQRQSHSQPSAKSATPRLQIDEGADPNSFSFGPDGVLRPKPTAETEPPNSFEEEASRAGVTWLHFPPGPRPVPVLHPTRRASRPAPSPSPPHQSDSTIGMRSREIAPPRAHRQSQLERESVTSPPPPPEAQQFIALSCLLDPSRRALGELVASVKAAAAVSSNNRPAPRFDPLQLTYENLLLLDSAPLSAAERAKKGLSTRQLLAIHSIRVHCPPAPSSASSLLLPQCSICQEELRHGDPALCLPRCRHIFHGQCIGPWLADHTICPNCRSPVAAEEEQR